MIKSLFSAIALAVCGLSLPVSCAAGERKGLRLGAWVTYWNLDRGIKVLQEKPAIFEDIYFFAVHLDEKGSPQLSVPEAALRDHLETVKAQKIRPWMTVVNDLQSAAGNVQKDPQIVHDLLSSPARRREHAGQIIELARGQGFAGVDIDYENLRAADRDVFSIFIEELAAGLRGRSLQLSVTVQPKTRETKSAGAGAADFARLGKAADRLQIMLYNQHSKKEEPGPIATPQFIKDILRFAELQCPPAKLVPILKLSGSDFGPDGVEGVRFDQAVALAGKHQAEIQRHQPGNVPFFKYQVDGKAHHVYFEDHESLKEKIEVIRSSRLQAVIFWSLGQEDPAVLRYLAELRS